MRLGQIGDAEWLPVVAELLGLDPEQARPLCETRSFVALGGTSLLAMELIAQLGRKCRQHVEFSAVLSDRPLAEVATTPITDSPLARDDGETAICRAGVTELMRSQAAMLIAEETFGGSAFHLLFSAVITGLVDQRRMELAIETITSRYAALHSVFAEDDEGEIVVRALPRWQPVIITQDMRVPVGSNPADAVHAQLSRSSVALLAPFRRPPVVFWITQMADGRTVVSMLTHHALIDGWGIGLVWQDLARQYATLADSTPSRAPGEAGSQSWDALLAVEREATERDLARARAAELKNWSLVAELPSVIDRPRDRSMAGARLPFELSPEAADCCTRASRRLGVTRNTVLLAAWTLVISRRAATSNVVVGVAVARRATTETATAVGCGATLIPVGCRTTGFPTTDAYIRGIGTALGEALNFMSVPFEDIVGALAAGGGTTRNPVAQFVFGAHDELIPAVIREGGLEWEIREGHCGGTAYDATLYVQHWDDTPLLALEYSIDALRADEAARLATAIDATLIELAAEERPLGETRTLSAEQASRIIGQGTGAPADTQADLWSLLADTARCHAGATAIHDEDQDLTYAQLLASAEGFSARLAAVGVRSDDCVALAVPPSVAEVVTILATLRLGACYMSLETTIPQDIQRQLLAATSARLVVCAADRLAGASAIAGGRPVIQAPVGPPARAIDDAPLPPAAIVDPDSVAYIAFTSGSTGIPKGARIARESIVSRAHRSDFLRPGACDRFMRFAPLGFDASTLEIFAPLLSGGCVEVFKGNPSPDELAGFLANRRITGLWLTAGLFRLVASYRPRAFTGVRQLLTGGDVVPGAQVRQVLATCPGLCVTNGYGPTENTTFTTVHHMDDPADVDDPVPIGRPIQGTGIVILDDKLRIAPPGCTGELFVYGAGVARGYVADPAETSRVFGRFCADIPAIMYRTGDIVTWDDRGRLSFRGRRDSQVKVSGFRVELDAVASALREHPAVRDSVVCAIGEPGNHRILAGLVMDRCPDLPEVLREYLSQRLPAYAIPTLWALTADFPMTPNGKVDFGALARMATRQQSGSTTDLVTKE